MFNRIGRQMEHPKAIKLGAATTSRPILKRPALGWRLTLVIATALFLTPFSPLRSAETKAAHLAVRGELDRPLDLGLADLQSMPREKISVRDHDGVPAVFEGVTLWKLVNRAQLRLGGKHNSAIARGYLVIHAADNYQAVFALAEIDPEFTNNKIILADQRDGKPLSDSQGPFQVIVPGDKIHARWVRQVTALEVVSQIR